MLKIGRTDRDIGKRMNELYTTEVPVPFDCVYACIVEDNEVVERLMHEKFAKYRYNPRREFFEVKPITAVKALKPYALEDVTPEAREDADRLLTKAERDARRRIRRELAKDHPDLANTKSIRLHVKVDKKKLPSE